MLTFQNYYLLLLYTRIPNIIHVISARDRKTARMTTVVCCLLDSNGSFELSVVGSAAAVITSMAPE